MSLDDLLSFLDRNGIDYRRCDHPAVYTVEEAARLVPPLPGAKTKNLFLRDKPGRRHFLVCVPAAKQVELRTLSDVIGCGRLSFGSADRLMARLGVEPGAVTLFAVFNDPGRTVELCVDEALWAQRGVPVPPAREHRHAGRQPRGRDALPGADRLPAQGDRGPGAGPVKTAYRAVIRRCAAPCVRCGVLGVRLAPPGLRALADGPIRGFQLSKSLPGAHPLIWGWRLALGFQHFR